MLKDLLRKDDYLVKIDLKDAYLTVPVWRDHQKYLRFLWRDSLLPLPPACQEFCPEKTEILRSSGQPRFRGPSGGSVVEKQSC